MDGGVKRRLRNSAGSVRAAVGLKEAVDNPVSSPTPSRSSRTTSTRPTPRTPSSTRPRRHVERSRSRRFLSSEKSLSVTSSEDITSEIIVQTDGLDMSEFQDSAISTPPKNNNPMPMGDNSLQISQQLLSTISQQHDGLQYPRSVSVSSDQSELSSVPSSISSKATTPVDFDRHNELANAQQGRSAPTSEPASTNNAKVDEPAPAAEPAASPRKPSQLRPRPAKFRIKHGQNRRYEVRPKVSIPSDVSAQEYAIQCIAAAESSRLNPYALHPDEYLMLRDHISQAQITTYLNLRNGILRLWVRNPTFVLTREEAIGCAKDSRWFDVANVCFDWLVREGYINFGCCEVRPPPRVKAGAENAPGPARRKTVVVIGAGLSGLGCARQLEGLFAQYARRFRERGEQQPKVVVLEGRQRVGGRVYSRPFKTTPSRNLDGDSPPMRYTAEMGGMIITGFDRGNPVNILLRGQLGLACHALRSDINLVNIYDTNGKPFDAARDMLIDKLYNHCIERVAEYKWKLPLPKLLEGKRDLIDEGKDSWAEVHKTISYVEEMAAAQPKSQLVAEQNIAPRVDLVPVSSDRATGRVHLEPGTSAAHKAARTVKMLGWPLKQGVSSDADIDLGPAASAPGATFGSVLDETLMQFKNLVDLSPRDMRMFNWHVANLEYSNATNVHQLSLRGWDIDMGNEWEGKHTMVVGGYQSLALGLAQCPTPLDIRYGQVVKAIRGPPAEVDQGEPGGSMGQYKIELEEGSSIDADYVVNTIPLGVLKHGDIKFDPPLPSWKTEAIERLGFGVLNKVILMYDRPFWEQDKDIFGVLRQPQGRSSAHPKDYSSVRGRFFQWFNVTNTSGVPTLLALMAGDAAFDTEKTPNEELVAEATEVLRSIFGRAVPEPTESIVTRWASDRFARGSYSSAGPRMQVEDYDTMSRPIGRHFFAGEHTSATHPATVHGAYMTGLRAAAEVLNDMLGPIDVQTPLIVPKETGTTSALLKRKSTAEHTRDPLKEAEEAWQIRLWEHQRSILGDYPLQPAKFATKAHLLFSKDNTEAARQRCLEGRRPGKGPPTAHEVRAMAGKMWTASSEEERRPYIEHAAKLKEANVKAMAEWTSRATEYTKRALEIAAEYEKTNPKPDAAAAEAGVKKQEQSPSLAATPAATSPVKDEAPQTSNVATGGRDGDDVAMMD